MRLGLPGGCFLFSLMRVGTRQNKYHGPGAKLESSPGLVPAALVSQRHHLLFNPAIIFFASSSLMPTNLSVGRLSQPSFRCIRFVRQCHLFQIAPLEPTQTVSP